MKKILLVLTCSVFGVVVFAGADTFSVASANTFGALKTISNITGADNFTYVAVPFEEFADAKDNTGKHPDNKRLFEGIIVPGLCRDYALMSILAPESAQTLAEDIWWGYSVSARADFWNPAQVTVGAGGTTVDSPYPDETYADVGSGVFWNPGASAPVVPYSIYSYGQVPTNYTKQVSFAAGKKLICPPGAHALSPLNLNEVEWGGVTASTFRLSGTKVRSVLSVGDMIQFKDPQTGIMKQLYYATVPGGNGEKKWGTVDQMQPFGVNAAVIPAGAAFWYIAKGSATLTWP